MMRGLSLRFAFFTLGVVFLACAATFGQGFLVPAEPIVVNSAHAYPTVSSLPGTPFLPVAFNSTSILAQLAHSTTGKVQLPPGDYSISFRIYCANVHAPQTQHGLVYRMAPLEGKRAPILIALESRAAAAPVQIPFQQLQQLIWQIMAGLSYSRMPPQSQALVDQLIPEFRKQLNEDFLTALQRQLELVKRLPGTSGVINEIELLIQKYQQTQNTLLQYANNFEALEKQMVNILPGTAENAGPSSWSQVNKRVYTRLADGTFYGQLGHLQIRVLPSNTRGTNASLSSGNLIATHDSSANSDSNLPATTDLAEVPIEAMIAYPNAGTMQGLTGVVEGGKTGSPFPTGTYFFKCSEYPGYATSTCSPAGSNLFTIQDNARAEQLVKSVVNQITCAGLYSSVSDFGNNTRKALSDLDNGVGTMIYFVYPGGSVGLSIDGAWGSAASAAWAAKDLGTGIGECVANLADDPVFAGLAAGLGVYISTRPPYTLNFLTVPIAPAGSLGTSNTTQVKIQATSLWQFLVPGLFQECSAFTSGSITTSSGMCPLGIVDAPVSVQLTSLGTTGGSANYSDPLGLKKTEITSSPASLQTDQTGFLTLNYLAGPPMPNAILIYEPTIPPNAPPQCYSLSSTTLMTQCETAVWTSPADAITAMGLDPSVPSVRDTYTYLLNPTAPFPLRGNTGSKNTSDASTQSTTSSVGISTISPTHGPVGMPITVKGTGFTNVTGVTIGGAKATFTVVSTTTIKATVPDISYADNTIKTLGSGSTVGVKVTVTTATGSATGRALFNYAGTK